MKILTNKFFTALPFLTQLAQQHLSSIFNIVILMEQRDVLLQFLQTVASVTTQPERSEGRSSARAAATD